RDHKAEWARWEAWLDQIATSVKRVDGVTTQIKQPNDGLSNRTPSLQIMWDGAKLGISGTEVARYVLDSEPRIVVAGSTAGSLSIVPYQMSPGDEKTVADRLYAVLSKPPKIDRALEAQGTPVSVAGQWDVHLEFVRGSINHKLILEQDGAKLMGTHEGEFASGDLSGTVARNSIRFQSGYPTE